MEQYLPKSKSETPRADCLPSDSRGMNIGPGEMEQEACLPEATQEDIALKALKAPERSQPKGGRAESEQLPEGRLPAGCFAYLST